MKSIMFNPLADRNFSVYLIRDLDAEVTKEDIKMLLKR